MYSVSLDVTCDQAAGYLDSPNREMFDVNLHLGRDMCSVSLDIARDKTAQYLVSSGREIVGVTFILGATCAVLVWMVRVMRQRDTLTRNV